MKHRLYNALVTLALGGVLGCNASTNTASAPEDLRSAGISRTQIVVILGPDAPWAPVDRLVAADGGKRKENRPEAERGRLCEYEFPVGTDLFAEAKRLRALPEVASAAPGFQGHSDGMEPDPR